VKKFITFSLIWYSQQFAIPFWIVGHIHLHLNTYNDWIEFGLSTIMHLSVISGFWLDWRNYKKTIR
jgi:hypothetical protein